MAAQDAPQRDVRITGVGTRSCSDWNEWKAARNAQARALALEWSQGFLAGHNVYGRPQSPEGPVVADAKALLPLLDAYCEKSPQARLVSVVMEIGRSLGGMKLRGNPTKPAAPGIAPDPKKGERES